MENRHSTKAFDKNKPANEEAIRTLIETVRLTPSSINSQPWHVFVITDQQAKDSISRLSWDVNSKRVSDASHLFVLCGKEDFSYDDILNVENLTAEARGKKVNFDRVDMMASFISKMGADGRKQWISNQVYLMLGQFLTSCAVLGIDCCPIEGFSRGDVDAALQLEEKGLKSMVVVAAGVSSDDDWAKVSNIKKVRFPKEKVMTKI